MNLEQIKNDMMMEEAIASAELAGAEYEDMTQDEKIKEIKEKCLDSWGILDLQFRSEYEQVEKELPEALQEYGQWVRQQTLEEATTETLRALETKYAIFHHSNLVDSNGDKIDGVKEYESLKDLMRYVLQALKDKNK